MPSELGETFEAWRKHRREVKQNNKNYSTQLLKDSGIEFAEHNEGLHLMIRLNSDIVDFWPSTGKWHMRRNNKWGRGVFKLLSELKKRH